MSFREGGGEHRSLQLLNRLDDSVSVYSEAMVVCF